MNIREQVLVDFLYSSFFRFILSFVRSSFLFVLSRSFIAFLCLYMLKRLLVCFQLKEDGHSHFETRVIEYTVWHAVAMSMRSTFHGKANYKICTSLRKSQFGIVCSMSACVGLYICVRNAAMQTAIVKQRVTVQLLF